MKNIKHVQIFEDSVGHGHVRHGGVFHESDALLDRFLAVVGDHTVLNSGQLSTICPPRHCITRAPSLQEKETSIQLRRFDRELDCCFFPNGAPIGRGIPWFTTMHGIEIGLCTSNTSNTTESKPPLLGAGPIFNFWSSLDVSSSAASDSKSNNDTDMRTGTMRLVERLACAQSKEQQQLQQRQQQRKRM